MTNSTKWIETECENHLNQIAEKVSKYHNISDIETYEELNDNKEDTFNSVKKKYIFYKASLSLFTFLEKPEYKKVSTQIHNFHDKICINQ